MLIFDLTETGNRMYKRRRLKHLTQAQLAEKAGLSDRAYADIERGKTNMRLETFLKICECLDTTPDALLVKEEEPVSEKVLSLLNGRSDSEKRTAVSLLDIYLNSLL